MSTVLALSSDGARILTDAIQSDLSVNASSQNSRQKLKLAAALLRTLRMQPLSIQDICGDTHDLKALTIAIRKWRCRSPR